MKKILYIFAAAAVAFASCDQYAEGDRYIENNQEGQGGGQSAFTKRVLVEDFTGQNCINCPNAANLLNQLKESIYGERMITVAMHAGGLALNTPLHSDTAEIYMKSLNLQNNPAISVDRSFTNDKDGNTWAAAIASQAAKTADMDINFIITNLNGKEFDIVYSVEFGKDVNEKLGVQVYLIENNITSFQVVPTGGRQQDYVHNHVFRLAMNGIWGKELKGETGDIMYLKGETYYGGINKVTIPENCNIDNCAIVGYVFTYSDDENRHIKEVLQVNEAHL